MSGGNWKALFKGIQDNDLELVKFYLRAGVDPNYQHPEFMALPLAESIRFHHLDIAQALLDYGADPSIMELESGDTVFTLVQRLNYKQAMALLKDFTV